MEGTILTTTAPFYLLSTYNPQTDLIVGGVELIPPPQFVFLTSSLLQEIFCQPNYPRTQPGLSLPTSTRPILGACDTSKPTSKPTNPIPNQYNQHLTSKQANFRTPNTTSKPPTSQATQPIANFQTNLPTANDAQGNHKISNIGRRTYFKHNELAKIDTICCLASFII